METTHTITLTDIQNLLAGEGGVDLKAVRAGGKQVAMRITGVLPGTTAARLGAQNDDTIESINDIALTSVSEAYRAGDVASQKNQIVIRGQRNGEAYTTVLNVSR